MPDLIKLNLGCGPHIAPGYVNVDIVPLPGGDLVADLDQPWPWQDGTVAEILASHLFEHVDRPLLFMPEAWRVPSHHALPPLPPTPSRPVVPAPHPPHNTPPP